MVSRRYLPASRGVIQSMMVEQRGAERPQHYGDLVRLVQTLQRLEVPEPGQQASRDALLTKLTAVAPSTMRGGRHRGSWSQA